MKYSRSNIVLILMALGLNYTGAEAATLTGIDVGTPSNPGSVITSTDTNGKTVYEVTGGGGDIWGASDNFYYAYQKVTGDFDYVVKVASHIGNSGDGGWSKAELMARLDDGSGMPQGGDPHISNMATRPSADTANGAPAGVNYRGPQWRAERDGQSSWTAPNPGYPPSANSNWLRMERIGSVFYMYTSNDGKTWNMYNPYSPQGWNTAGSYPPGTDNAAVSVFNQAWPNTILLGLAVTAHNDGGVSVVKFTDYGPYTPIPITITAQPAATVSISANTTLTLSVTASGDPLHYQWLKNGNAITGAITSTLKIDLAKTSDAGKYSVKCYGGGKEVISTESVVTVTADTQPPTIAKVSGSDTFTEIKVIFSEPVNSTAENKANYSLDQGISISGVTRVDAKTISLQTSKMDIGKNYLLTVNGIQDTASPANVIAAGTTKTFQSYVFMAGMVLHKKWENASANNISALTSDTRFPNNPTTTEVLTSWEWPPNGGNEGGSNYGNQLIGWFTPAQSGDYIFFTCSDDPSNLYLSTDDNPANKKLIAQETGWSGARQWIAVGSGDVTSKRSDQFGATEWPYGNQITLQAGKKYYIESLHTEGGGGDNVGATFIRAGANDPANGSAPAFTGNLIGTYVDAKNGPPVISKSPQPVYVDAGGTATFTVEMSFGAEPMEFQWRFNGKNIAGETSQTLSIKNAQISNVGNYDVIVKNADGSVTSGAARLIVPGAQSALLVVQNDPANLNASDAGVKARLESQGWKVFPIGAAVSQTSDANGFALLVISSTVSSGDVGNKFRTVPVPVVSWEQAVQDNFLMTTDEADVTRGSITAQQQINIVKSGHAMSAGLSTGALTVFTAATDITYGKPASSAVIIAGTADDASRAVIYGYDKDALLIDGSTKAPARRVHFLMTDNAFANLNSDGLKLFDAAVAWAANFTAKPQVPTLSFALSSGKLIITFEGTLQSADKADGSYTDITGPSPMTITPSGVMKFYRAKR